jgi:hypothetical protein
MRKIGKEKRLKWCRFRGGVRIVILRLVVFGLAECSYELLEVDTTVAIDVDFFDHVLDWKIKKVVPFLYENLLA